MIKAVIFDFGGVLAPEGFWNWIKKHVPDWELRKPEIDKLSEKVDIGELPGAAYSEYLAKLTGKQAHVVEEEILKEYIVLEEMHDIVKKLHTKVKTAILSNFPQEWFYPILDKLKLRPYFDVIIVSSEHGLVKPGKEIYQKVLSQLNVQPEEAVFTDDREHQVIVAQNLGMSGITFTTPKDFVSKLTGLGIEVS